MYYTFPGFKKKKTNPLWSYLLISYNNRIHAGCAKLINARIYSERVTQIRNRSTFWLLWKMVWKENNWMFWILQFSLLRHPRNQNHQSTEPIKCTCLCTLKSVPKRALSVKKNENFESILFSAVLRFISRKQKKQKPFMFSEDWLTSRKYFSKSRFPNLLFCATVRRETVFRVKQQTGP